MAANGPFRKPKTIEHDKNSAKISWEYVFENTCSKCRFALQILNDIKSEGWHTIYCGGKSTFTVDGLAPCSFYHLRLKNLCLEHSTDWLEFKTTTDDGPFLIRHMTRAVDLEKITLMRKIVSQRPELLQTVNNKNKTPLIEVCEKGNIELAAFLIALGANVNVTTLYTKRSALMTAIFNRNLEMAELLIEKGADVNLRDVNNLNILHCAVDSDYPNGIEFVLKYYKDIDSQDNQGWSPLTRAVVMECNQEVINLLLKNGANTKIKDKNGFNFQKLKELSKKYRHEE